MANPASQPCLLRTLTLRRDGIATRDVAATWFEANRNGDHVFRALPENLDTLGVEGEGVVIPVKNVVFTAVLKLGSGAGTVEVAQGVLVVSVVSVDPVSKEQIEEAQAFCVSHMDVLVRHALDTCEKNIAGGTRRDVFALLRKPEPVPS